MPRSSKRSELGKAPPSYDTSFETLPGYDAIRLQQLHQISYWDAQIVAAADTAGCTVLYSEDLNAGQKYANVTVVNPFMEC